MSGSKVSFLLVLIAVVCYLRYESFNSVDVKLEDTFVYHPEVLYALQHGDPVVALESTIITHGS